jgi:hypothetical protein
MSISILCQIHGKEKWLDGDLQEVQPQGNHNVQSFGRIRTIDSFMAD